jgi:hypothetical protein
MSDSDFIMVNDLIFSDLNCDSDSPTIINLSDDLQSNTINISIAEPTYDNLDDLLSKPSLLIKQKFDLENQLPPNPDEAEHFIKTQYPSINITYNFISDDHGYNLGTIKNVIEGIRYIKNNKSFDYIINVEADNMFYFEDVLIRIINMMDEQNKHMLLVEEGHGREPHNKLASQGAPSCFHFTTLNIFSNLFIEKYFPFEYYQDYINYTWCGRPHTPYECYMGFATMKKNNLIEEKQMEFYEKVGLRLDYDRNASPLGWNEPDNMVPEKFLKWGMINAPSTAGGEINADWTRLKDFIIKHEPLRTNYLI